VTVELNHGGSDAPAAGPEDSVPSGAADAAAQRRAPNRRKPEKCSSGRSAWARPRRCASRCPTIVREPRIAAHFTAAPRMLLLLRLIDARLERVLTAAQETS
jgi:hypothetical protein